MVLLKAVTVLLIIDLFTGYFHTNPHTLITLTSAQIGIGAKCADIAWSGSVWGATSAGVNLSSYTNGELQLLALQSNTGFNCFDTTLSITFNSTSTMRALLGSGPLPTSGGCCSSLNPRGVCNAPDDQVSATKLCEQLGYNAATFIAVDSNTCPEAHWDGTQLQWMSDYVSSSGFGTEFKCEYIPPSPAKCSDIAWSGTPWGSSFIGANLSPYTENELQLIGCQSTNGYYCSETSRSITFGGTCTVRALLGPGTMPTSFTSCCTLANPRDVCNSPDDQVSVTQLCRQLGYTKGTFIAMDTNSCPELHWDASGSQWTSDYDASAGYGKEYTCIDTVPAKCSDIEWSGSVWGVSYYGANLSAYTDELQFIGCAANGCFYCSDTSTSITFGGTSTLRTLVGTGAYPSSGGTCCSALNPRGFCNSPDDQASIDELCIQLGYDNGTFTRVGGNTCPEAHWDGTVWTSDYVRTAGYSSEIKCTSWTSAPTTAPTPKPTHHPSRNPSKNPTIRPTTNPTISPTIATQHPTTQTKHPTNPTSQPTNPTLSPTDTTQEPTVSPTHKPPTSAPINPSKSPTRNPTRLPTENPTRSPTDHPTLNPTRFPTKNPTRSPTANPTRAPSKNPISSPSKTPSGSPSVNPTAPTTPNPSASPTANPFPNPTPSPVGPPSHVLIFQDDDKGNIYEILIGTGFVIGILLWM